MAEDYLKCTISYKDEKGKFFQGSLSAKILGLIGDSLKARMAETVIVKGQKKVLPWMGISPRLVDELRDLSKNRTTRKGMELIMNRALAPAITQKFTSKGFGTWRGLARATIKRKIKYKYHPLLETLALKKEIRDHWKIRGFQFGEVPPERVGIEDIKPEDLKPLGFNISFPRERRIKPPYPYTKLPSFQALIGIHTRGISKPGRPILPPRNVLLTRTEFATHVWSRSLKDFAGLWKGEFRRRAPKIKPILPLKRRLTSEKFLMSSEFLWRMKLLND